MPNAHPPRCHARDGRCGYGAQCVRELGHQPREAHVFADHSETYETHDSLRDLAHRELMQIHAHAETAHHAR